MAKNKTRSTRDAPRETAAASARPGFLTRLKQHHMFRIASWYATLAYVLILVANAVFPDIGYTRDDVRYVIVALALGFPIVLTLSWMFVSPSREDPKTFGRWKRLRWRLGSGVALLVIAFVTASGAYLWRLNARHQDAVLEATGPQSIVVLPYDRRGVVDDTMVAGMQETLENALGDLGTVSVISHHRFMSGGDTLPLDQIVKATGATLVLQGSISRADKASLYEVKTELVATDGLESLYSIDRTYSAAASVADIEQTAAIEISGPIRFLTHRDDWFAKGYPTTKNPRALRLLHQSLATLSYFGPLENRLPLMRQAIEADPNFAQAHAYLAMLDVMTTTIDVQYRKSPSVDTEVARALELSPGLPEAELAPAMDDVNSNRWEQAEEKFKALEGPLPNNYFVRFFRGFSLRHLGRWDEALNEFKLSSALDPYTIRTVTFTGQVGLAKREYDDTASYLTSAINRWPLYITPVLWRAQVVFAERGDVVALASVINGDLSKYEIGSTSHALTAKRIEVSHLQGRHADVIKALKAFPVNDISDNESAFGSLVGRTLFTDSLTAESYLLLKDNEAAAEAATLGLPSAIQDAANHPQDNAYLIHVALLQTFRADYQAAMKTLAPLLGRLSGPPDRWSGDDANISSDVAVVLAWCGKKQDAIAILAKSLAVYDGAHAAILAHDPVWRPLYSEPAFKDLLATHGQVLAYAK